MEQDIEATVLSVFKQNVKPDIAAKLAPDAELQKDLGLNSLRLMGILLQLEELFEIDITALEVEPASLRTIRDLVALSQELISHPPVEGTSAT